MAISLNFKTFVQSGLMKFEENNADSTGIDHRWSQNIHIFLNTYTAELLEINDATTASNDGLEANEVNSTGLLEISDNTTVHLLEIIGKELPKDVSKDNRLNENWIPTVKDLREVTTPDSWTKWNLPMKLAEELRLRIHSEKGFLVVQSLRDSVCYVVDLSDVPKCGSFNPYGNEQMAEDETRIVKAFEDAEKISDNAKTMFSNYIQGRKISLQDVAQYDEEVMKNAVKTVPGLDGFDIAQIIAFFNSQRTVFGMDVEEKVKEKIIPTACTEIAASLHLLRNFANPFISISFDKHDLSPFEREIPRDDFFRSLCERWKLYFDDPTVTLSAEERRTRNRLLTTSCFPGGGKTFFLDYLSTFMTTIDQSYVQMLFPLWPVDALVACGKYLQSLIILKISFNGWSGIESGHGVDRYTQEISLRMLYSFYFTQGEGQSFAKFTQCIAPKFLSPVTVADCISWFDESLNYQANYLLFVDELEKTARAMELCSYICKFMEAFTTRLDCFFTNLDASVMVGASITGSQRSINWITLPPPDITCAKKILSDSDKTIPRLIIVEVSGHWRSIMLLRKVLKELEYWDYDIIFESLLQNLKHFAQSLTEPLVEACFSRHRYSLSDSIAHHQVSKLISNGLFLNSIKDQFSEIYPDFSLLLLKQWAYQDKGNKPQTFTHLRFLFAELFKLDSNTTWSFSSYESFHCYWLAIYHYCRHFESDRIATISQFYPARLIVNHCEETTLKFLKIMYVTQVTWKNIGQIEFNKIYLLGKSNPGFDSIIFYESNDGATVAVASENKFSDPDSTTQFSPSHAVEKRNLAVDAITKKFDIKEDNIFLVFPLWRDVPNYMKISEDKTVTSKAKGEIETLRNIILLRREDLAFLYGPLFRRLYFGDDDSCPSNPTTPKLTLKKKGDEAESTRDTKKLKIHHGGTSDNT